jgi:GNAT superfamily N-acetyltransferase
LSPNTCFVLDDGNGRVVGYCIGTADTASFAQRWRDVFTPVVDPKLVPHPDLQTGDALMERDDIRHFRRAVYDAECSMLQPWPQTLQQYPAHMHIDILPEYQRQGWGTVLINRFFEAVKSLDTSGVHLDMVQSNVSGMVFYEKIGFQVCPQVLDGGASGDPGVNGIVITLVKDLSSH